MPDLTATILESGELTVSAFLAATACSLVLGFFIASVYAKREGFSQSFLITLVLLPAIVQLVIMLVNGNIGAGVAVAGAFSLVRFRSAPGTGQEITAIFLAMAVGLATGMGFLGVAVLFAVVIVLVNTLLVLLHFGTKGSGERILKITIPESLDYEGIFDEILKKYTKKAELTQVSTTNLGSLYRLSYSVELKSGVSLKDMIDELRTRNGNLEISCGRPVSSLEQL